MSNLNILLKLNFYFKIVNFNTFSALCELLVETNLFTFQSGYLPLDTATKISIEIVILSSSTQFPHFVSYPDIFACLTSGQM